MRELGGGRHRIAAELPKMRRICYMSETPPDPTCVQLPSHQEVGTHKREYAVRRSSSSTTNRTRFAASACVSSQDTDRYLIQNQPCLPLSREALDAVYDLPYTRT